MKQKVVKLEIGKLVAIVIAVVVIAFAAGFYIQSSYFQGIVGVDRTHTVLMDETAGELRALINRPNVSDRAVNDAFVLFETELGKLAGKENANITVENLTRLLKEGKSQDLNKHLSSFEVNLKRKPFSEAYQLLDYDSAKSVDSAQLDSTLK